MTLMRFRRSLPAIIARTIFPASSSTENMPDLNFSTTLPITSIESSFGKLFAILSRRGAGLHCTRACFPLLFYLPAVLPRAAAITAIATAARATFTFGTSFVDVQRPAVDFLAIEAIDRGIPFRIDAHLNKCETSCLSSVTVCHDVHPIDAAIRFEHGTNGIFGRPKTEIANKNVFHFYTF